MANFEAPTESLQNVSREIVSGAIRYVSGFNRLEAVVTEDNLKASLNNAGYVASKKRKTELYDTILAELGANDRYTIETKQNSEYISNEYTIKIKKASN